MHWHVKFHVKKTNLISQNVAIIDLQKGPIINRRLENEINKKLLRSTIPTLFEATN